MYNINKLVSNKIFKIICAVFIARMLYDFLCSFHYIKQDIKHYNNNLDGSHDREDSSTGTEMETKTNDDIMWITGSG